MERPELCAAMDCVIPPKSFGKIVVTNQDVFGSRDVVVTGSKRLQLEKGLFIPSSLVRFLHGRAVLWVTNSTHQSQVIPSDMKVGTIQDLEVGSISNLDACSEIAGKDEVTSPDVRECLILMIYTDLEETKKNRLLTCLNEFADIFDFEKKSFPVSGEIKHKIDTSDYLPVRQCPYRVSPAERRVIQSEVEKMMGTKIIKSIIKASPVILMRKKDSSLRFCVDSRLLNKITKKNVYPLPRIDDALDTLARYRYFSTMDLRSGYWQIEVDDKDREVLGTKFQHFDGILGRSTSDPCQNKRKIDSVEPEETSMNVKKEGTQVSNYVVQHLPRNPSIFSGEDGEDLQKWLKGYARVAKYNHWDETLCLTKVYFYLSGTALKWFENNEESIQTWKEFTSQLENVFGKKENSKLQAEKKLKTRAQLKGESTECYIQDLLCLCKEVDPQMSEEDKISHLMKGIAEELYQALLPRDVQSTEQFIIECRRVEALRCRRVTPTRYERLPNVASLCDQDAGEDLSTMIRQIVCEEVQRALGSPREEPKNATIEEIVKEEIGRTLAPISKSRRSPPQKERPRQFLNTRCEAKTIRPHPEPRYLKQGGRRDTNDWRTTEGRPICFYCGRPGHVVRYCRDRKRHNEERRNDYFQRKQDAM
ncbi:K02A2.6-like, partial [Cordylochernes scorpioides]